MMNMILFQEKLKEEHEDWDEEQLKNMVDQLPEYVAMETTQRRDGGQKPGKANVGCVLETFHQWCFSSQLKF